MIVIAGAGIGGLTLGCALMRAHRSFRLVERAAELRPIGAGIALSANAFRALAHIGLEDQVRGVGRELDFAAICDPSGKVLIGAGVREVAGGSVALARADLQKVLLEALGGSVEMYHAVTSYESGSNGVCVRLANGMTIDAELLVGADGLHSTVRRVMRGDEPLRYTGQTSWRAIVDNVALLYPGRFTETWGAKQRFGIVPLRDGRAYWFAVAEAPRGQSDEGDPRPGLRSRFARWHAPIDHILANTPRDRILRTDILDRAPIDCWVKERTVLLGDAAHPMTPDGGMGGAQAIEDAVVLAHALAHEHGFDAALARYQALRIPRANRFVRRSYCIGQIANLRPAHLRWLRDRALRAVPKWVVARAMARDFEFSV